MNFMQKKITYLYKFNNNVRRYSLSRVGVLLKIYYSMISILIIGSFMRKNMDVIQNILTSFLLPFVHNISHM